MVEEVRLGTIVYRGGQWYSERPPTIEESLGLPQRRGGFSRGITREEERARKEKAEQLRQQELERQRQLELERQRQEQLRQEQQARIQRQRGFAYSQQLSRQEQIRLGKEEGLIVKQVGESKQAYEYRLAQRGRALERFAPKGTREYIKATRREEPTEITKGYTGEERMETPYIEERVVGTWKYKGKTIPITKIFYVEPVVYGEIGEKKDRLATDKEISWFRKQKVLGKEALTEIGLFSRTKEKIIYAYEKTEPYEKVGLSDKQIRKIISNKYISTSLYFVGRLATPLPVKLRKEQVIEGTTGFISGVLPQTKKELVRDVLTYGAFAGIGAGLKGAERGLSYVPKAGKYIAGVFKGTTAIAGIGLGGYYVFTKSKEYGKATTEFEKGEVLGKSAKEIYLAGKGFQAGTRTALKVEGYFKTKGRTYVSEELLIPKEVLTGKEGFPTAKKELHLKLFRKKVAGKYVDPFGRAGAFHTTPERFWKGEITAKAGTSELAGLYGSAYVSPNFAKITGKTSISEGFSIRNYLKNLFISQDPAIAYLKPKGFRVSQFKKVKGRYEFTLPAEKGIADVPLMKTEIEAIFRTNAGSYILESQKVYTRIKDVRVPIDIFGYKDVSVPVKDIGVNLVGGKAGGYSISSITSQAKTIPPMVSSKVSRSYSEISVVSMPSIPRPSSKSSMYEISRIKSLIISKPSRISRGRELIYRRYSERLYPREEKPVVSPLIITPFIPKRKPKRKKGGRYVVSVRRFGKFRPIGIFRSEKKAFAIGKGRVAGTLGASFKVEGLKISSKLPKGFYRSKKEKGVLIEKRKFRLSKKGEKLEIQKFRRKLEW